MQCKKVELRALQDRVERQKCRIMTCRMKLIRINDERFQKGGSRKIHSWDEIPAEITLFEDCYIRSGGGGWDWRRYDVPAVRESSSFIWLVSWT